MSDSANIPNEDLFPTNSPEGKAYELLSSPEVLEFFEFPEGGIYVTEEVGGYAVERVIPNYRKEIESILQAGAIQEWSPAVEREHAEEPFCYMVFDRSGAVRYIFDNGEKNGHKKFQVTISDQINHYSVELIDGGVSHLCTIDYDSDGNKPLWPWPCSWKLDFNPHVYVGDYSIPVENPLYLEPK